MYRPTPKATGIFLALIALPVLSGLFFWFASLRTDSEILQTARDHLKARRYSKAEDEASSVPPDSTTFTQAMLIAGEAASRLNRLPQAAEYYRRVPHSLSPEYIRAATALANIDIHIGQLSEAIQNFQFVLQQNPADLPSHSRIAFLFAAAARSQQARPHLQLLLKSGSATAQELALLGDLERPVDEREFLLKSQQLNPLDPHIRLGLAASSILDGNLTAARASLEQLLREYPADPDAAALLLELLAPIPDNSFQQLDATLPATTPLHPDIWYARGMRFRSSQPPTAIRCFLEALKSSPFHRRACYQLGRALTELNHPAATQFSNLAADLFTLSNALKLAADSDGQDHNSVKTIVQILEQQGRIWETCAWAQFARQSFPEHSWPTPILQRLAPLLNQQLPFTLPEKLPASLLNPNDFPEYKNTRPIPNPQTQSPATTPPPSQPPLKFIERTSIGLEFTCLSPTDPATPGQRMQEQTGGGLAVLDLDLDGWPDLHCTQSAPWDSSAALPSHSPQLADQLFRNLRGQAFTDVTANSGMLDLQFSQGAATGDFNQDGFDDLYIANIGPNSLWLNNGDGTWTPHTPPSTPTNINANSPRWCSSCAIVDLNQDALPDLIDINYVSGPNVYSLICNGRACSPSTFSGTLPEIHISNGDGSFLSIPASVPIANAKGLGLVVFKDTPDTPPAIFVANDQTPKFLLKPESINGQLQFTDHASQTGLAFNGDGVLTAAMGIAAADLDHSGTTDFFVTNFRDEPNTLYLQIAPQLFHDNSRTSGLDTPGLPYVGWGAQFLDADLDGDQDLVTANGHIEDYRDQGAEFEMRPQLFRNLGENRFEEISSTDAGPWFQRRFLGRALATLDWNRDTRTDFAVSHINSPVSLVENQSPPSGAAITIHLHATTTDRNAWFTQIEANSPSDNQLIKEQLRAGSGYHASNQRTIQIAPGPIQTTDPQSLSLTIHWPSGKATSLTSVPLGATIHVVENHPTYLLSPQ